MKLIHLSDLHLGKRVNEFSMLEEQTYILKRILAIVDDEKPDGVLIAGDVYDKGVPSAEAVALCDDFLTRLAARKLPVFMISGNHDSPERLAFGSRLMDKSGVHIAPVYRGAVEPLTLSDEYGELHIWLLPFLKPAAVRPFFEGRIIESYTDAVGAAIEAMPVDPAARNVLVAHQFVTGSRRCASEEISVGGSDNVDAVLFDVFDYVALGHIHTPQRVGRESLRYCGSPLKYSFSEAGRDKTLTVVELGEKGNVAVRELPLCPRHDLREIRGSYKELTRKSYYDGTGLQNAYLHVTLTDEQDIPEAVGKLRAVYPLLMKLDYDNTRTRAGGEVLPAEDTEQKTPLELFAEFYEKQNGQPMTTEQSALVARFIEKIWGAGT